MQEYYGTPRKIKAKPMTRGEYNDYLGKPVTADADRFSPIPFDCKGYLIKFEDGETGWTTNDVLGAAYQPTHALSFGHALEVLKSGGKVRRSSWEAKDVFLKRLEDGSGQEYLGIGSAISSGFPRSRPTDADLFANDWEIVE